MNKLILTAAALAAITGSMTGAAFAASPFKTVETAKGGVLAGDKGMTLYTFKNDKTGTSNCYDKCAQNWPPAMAASDAKAEGAYSLVTRKDGMKQWAKDGMPLYYWAKDTKEGDVTGDGFNGVWDVAKP
jgi:predicted lipoprotein with Yx(FWY)xxD motif